MATTEERKVLKAIYPKSKGWAERVDKMKASTVREIYDRYQKFKKQGWFE